MYRSKKTRIVSLLALVLCIAIAAVFAFTFAGCDDESASADSGLTWGQERGYVMGGGSIYTNDRGYDIYEEMPETLKSEIVDPVFVENQNVTITGKFDENGVAPCTYYNTTDRLSSVLLSGYGCNECRSVVCKGHSGYVCYSGYAQSNYFYPYTIAPISTTAETIELQCMLIFTAYENSPNAPEITDGSFSRTPSVIAFSSLTGEPLDVANVKVYRILQYDPHYQCPGYDYVAVPLEDASTAHGVSTHMWGAKRDEEAESAQDWCTPMFDDQMYYVFSVELANGDVYEYGLEINTYHFLEEAKEDIEIEDGDDMSAA